MAVVSLDDEPDCEGGTQRADFGPLPLQKPAQRPGAGQRSRVIVDRASKDQKVAAGSYKNAVAKSWTRITKIRDEETTTKRERKNDRFTYFYECLGTDNDLGPCWGRFVTYLLYSEKRTTRYKVDYVHWAKIDEYNADKKAFRKAADALWKKFKL